MDPKLIVAFTGCEQEPPCIGCELDAEAVLTKLALAGYAVVEAPTLVVPREDQ